MKVFEPTGPEEIAYSGRIIEVVNQPMSNGRKEISFEWGQRAPGVRLVAVNDEGKILLTKEHRYELDDFDYRLPGGKVADTLEEWHAIKDLPAAAKQKVIAEAKEEAGLVLREVTPIEVVPDGTTFKWDLHYFESKSFDIHNQALEHGEQITVGWYTPQEVLSLIAQKKIREGRSVYILMPYLLDRA